MVGCENYLPKIYLKFKRKKTNKTSQPTGIAFCCAPNILFLFRHLLMKVPKYNVKFTQFFLQTTGLSDFLGKSNVIFSSSPQASASTATSHKAPSPTPGNVSLHIKGTFTLTEIESDKNVLYRIMWRCSYCTETPVQLATVTALSVSISVWVSVYVGVNVPKIDQPNYVHINLRDGEANKKFVLLHCSW